MVTRGRDGWRGNADQRKRRHAGAGKRNATGRGRNQRRATGNETKVGTSGWWPAARRWCGRPRPRWTTSSCTPQHAMTAGRCRPARTRGTDKGSVRLWCCIRSTGGSRQSKSACNPELMDIDGVGFVLDEQILEVSTATCSAHQVQYSVLEPQQAARVHGDPSHKKKEHARAPPAAAGRGGPHSCPARPRPLRRPSPRPAVAAPTWSAPPLCRSAAGASRPHRRGRGAATPDRRRRRRRGGGAHVRAPRLSAGARPARGDEKKKSGPAEARRGRQPTTAAPRAARSVAGGGQGARGARRAAPAAVAAAARHTPQGGK